MFKRDEKLISEYKNSLKYLRESQRAIEKKKQSTYQVKDGEEITIDERTTAEKEDQSKLASMIRDCEYSLFWLENGYEKPYGNDTFRKLSKSKREQLWADVDELIGYYGTSVVTKDQATGQKTERHEQVLEVLSTLSPRELELFKLKNEAMLTEQECAEKMDVSVGTIKSMSQRIRDKIDNYFNYGFQMELF